MLTAKEIKTFINNDKTSDQKKQAEVGQRYYDAKHDILQYRIMYLNKEGRLQEDTAKSNVRISHAFFSELADQEVQHLLSETERIFTAEDDALQEHLDAYFNMNEDFTAELYETMLDRTVMGTGYMYAHKNKEGRTTFQRADSMGVVEVRAKETDDGCEYVIFWYVDRIGKDNKKINRIQVWSKNQVAYFVQVGNGAIVPDTDEKPNPAPHSIYHKEGDESAYFEDYGFIPFFRLDNNRKRLSDLHRIKGHIDDYDLMACGLSNNIQDMSEAYIAVKGYEGENLDVLAMNFRAKKHIGVGEGGEIEIKTVDIPYQARQAKLELDETSIYRFGQGFNAAQRREGNVTDDEVESRYELLNLKCNRKEIYLKKFLRKLLKVVLDEINQEEGKGYRLQDVKITFKRRTVTDKEKDARVELTNAQTKQTNTNTILNVDAKIGDDMTTELIAQTMDIDLDKVKKSRQKMEDDPLAMARMATNSIIPEDDAPDGDLSA